MGCQQPAVNLVLISLDTLRADHLGCYGYPRPTSPTLDRLADSGVLFETALAPSAWTLPAHATMLSGRSPRHHRAVDLTRRIADGIPLLAEMLAAEGYSTAAVVNGVFLQGKYGFDRGFDTFVYVPKKQWRRHQAAVLEQVRSARQGPLFFFFHYMRTHNDYAAPAAYRRLVRPYHGPIDLDRQSVRDLKRAIESGEPALSAADLDHLIDLYDSSILFADHLVGEVLELLEAVAPGPTVVVVTSDHGEEFLEHGSLLHNGTLYEEVLRVPLIVRGPGVPAGWRLAGTAGLVDLVPTLLDLLGLPPQPGLDGRSLAGAWRGALVAEPMLELLTSYPQGHGMKAGLRTAGSKLIVDLETGHREFFDLAADPREERNLYPDPRARALEGRLELGALDLPPQPVRLDPDDLEALRSLGYSD